MKGYKGCGLEAFMGMGGGVGEHIDKHVHNITTTTTINITCTPRHPNHDHNQHQQSQPLMHTPLAPHTCNIPSSSILLHHILPATPYPPSPLTLLFSYKHTMPTANPQHNITMEAKNHQN